MINRAPSPSPMHQKEIESIRGYYTVHLRWIIRDTAAHADYLRRTQPSDLDWETEAAEYEESVKLAKDELARRGEL
jgi:hypothetical protein